MEKNKKGIILAGGNGTRLRPLTYVTNKHLIGVYNKPMVLYPIETLKSLGIKDILIISGGEHIGDFTNFLGDGSEYGVRLTYKVQKEAGGIGQALLLGEDFVEDQFAVILGDNIFDGGMLEWPKECGIIIKEVENPSRFGVYSDRHIIEKPIKPQSNMVVTGLYFYTPEVFKFLKTLSPSSRGEIEITDLNNWAIDNSKTSIMKYEGFWSDAGTFESLYNATSYMKQKNDSERD